MSDKRIYGYARVSSKNQNESRQVKALLDYGCSQRDIFIDKASGKDFSRPEYEKLKTLLCPEDELVVLDLDRLGRNYEQMRDEWNEITRTLGCDITVLNCPAVSTKTNNGNSLDTRLIADIIFQVISYFAERERLSIRERQREGILCAKAAGVQFGRPKIQKPAEFDSLYQKVLKKQMTNKEAMNRMGLKTNVYYSFVKEFREEQGV